LYREKKKIKGEHRMSRYIDADKLTFSRIRIIHSDGTSGGWNAVVMSSVINNAPTADVAPIVHASWNEDGRCSNCDWYMPFDCEGNGVESEYCPVCGAKMDGERREE
jgi:hypothetical protein